MNSTYHLLESIDKKNILNCIFLVLDIIKKTTLM